MTDRFNTFAGWLLFAGIIGLGLSILSGMYFGADRPHRPHDLGYVIEGAEEEGAAEGPSLASLLAAADIDAGQRSFAKCVACHTIEQGGAQGIGPNLFGIMGLPIGQHVPGYAYSSALAGHGGIWDFENMDDWLRSPRAFANGTKMSFAGLGSAEERANLIAYMNSMGPGLPLPAVEAAPVEEEVAAEEGAEAELEAGEAAAE